MSAEERLEVSKRMQKYWASRRKQKTGAPKTPSTGNPDWRRNAEPGGRFAILL